MLADFLKDYLSIILFLIIALGLSIIFIAINYLAAPKNPDPEKLSETKKDDKSQASIQ